MPDDPLSLAPEMVPFVTAAELEKAEAIKAQLDKEAAEMAAFWRQHEKDVERDHQRHLERERNRRERRGSRK